MRLPEVNKYKLISVDIFDTLLLRAVAKPIDIFEKVWEDVLKEDKALTELNPSEYKKLRVEMERRARNEAENREVTLSQIYQQYPSYIVEDIEGLRHLEIQKEEEYCYRNDEIWEWIKNAYEKGIKIVLLSDMYLSNLEIRRILEKNNIDISCFEHIIISNEHHCNKQNGELYQVLMQYYPELKAKDILHIGDNKNSDYEQPLKLGINAFFYAVIPEQLYSIYDYEKIRHNIPMPEILSLRKVCMSKTNHTGDKRVAYEIGSTIIGPVLTLFISWLYNRMEKLDISRVYPLMREGWLLGKLLEGECADRGKLLEVHPIYVSRKVTYIASITEINREEIENLIGARNLTIEESIRLVGLDLAEFEELQKYYSILYKHSHEIPYEETTVKEYVIHKFLEKDNKEKILKYVTEERKKLVRYLIQEIKDFDNIATVDIGFFGRIQMWMEKSLSIENIPFKIKHFLAIGITGEKVYDGLNFEGMFGTYDGNQDLIQVIHRTTDVVEKLISVTEGSTIGYEEKQGRIYPVREKGIRQKELTEIVFQGVFEFQKLWFEFRKKKPEIAEECLGKKREILEILHRLIDMPRKEEAEFLAKFQADTNFGTDYRKGIITEEHLTLAKEKGIDFVDKCNISYTYQDSNITWPKGTITLLDEFYYVRKALKNGSQNEVIKSMQEVVENIQQDGITEVALYGAGENGRQFYFICQMYHIKVQCFIDRKESLWGTKKEGIEVIGIKEAVQRGYDNYIITSLFSIGEIRQVIEQNYQKSERKAKIYSV